MDVTNRGIHPEHAQHFMPLPSQAYAYNRSKHPTNQHTMTTIETIQFAAAFTVAVGIPTAGLWLMLRPQPKQPLMVLPPPNEDWRPRLLLLASDDTVTAPLLPMHTAYRGTYDCPMEERFALMTLGRVLSFGLEDDPFAHDPEVIADDCAVAACEPARPRRARFLGE